MGTKAALTASSYEEAKRKAVRGHSDWIAYTARDGQRTFERMTAGAVKRAMLAMGTKGHFTLIEANTAVGYRYSWRSAVILYARAVRGFPYA